MKIDFKNKIKYFIIFIVFILIFLFGKTISNATSFVLLKPYSIICEMFYNDTHVYRQSIGFVEQTGRYAISPSCLGINFVAILFVTITFPFIKDMNIRKSIKWILISFIGSVFIGFIANNIRILSSVPFSNYSKFNLIHSTLGIIIYLFILIACYSYLLKRKEEKNEEII